MRIPVRKAVKGFVALIIGGVGFLLTYLALALLLIKFDTYRVCDVHVIEPFWKIGASHKYCYELLSLAARPLGVESRVHACIYDTRCRQFFQKRALEKQSATGSHGVWSEPGEIDVWK